jgi:hypothetical protein
MNVGFGSDAEGGTGPFGTADGFYSSSNTASGWPAAMPPTLHQRGALGGAFPGGSGFAVESNSMGGSGPLPGDLEDYTNEPPLLQELGVDFGHIRTKVTAVLMLTKPIDPTIMQDADMAGPLVFCLILGLCLLLVSFDGR